MENIRLVIHPTQKGLLDSYLGFDSNIDLPDEYRVHRFNTDTNQYEESTLVELINWICIRGYWGFCRDKEEIHIWYNKRNTSFEELFVLISHEVGHCIAPYKRDVEKEEQKAEQFSQYALKALDLTQQLKHVEFEE